MFVLRGILTREVGVPLGPRPPRLARPRDVMFPAFAWRNRVLPSKLPFYAGVTGVSIGGKLAGQARELHKKVGAPSARVSGQRALPDESVQPGRAPGITSRHSILLGATLVVGSAPNSVDIPLDVVGPRGSRTLRH